VRFIFISLIFLQSCAVFQSFRSPASAYESYLESNVKTQKLYKEGSSVFGVKAVVVTKELLDLQEKVGVSSYGHPPRPNLSERSRIVVVAFGTLDGAGPTAAQMVLTLGGRTHLSVRGIQDENIVKNLYSFAYPYYRVYWAEFLPPTVSDAVNVEKLIVRGAGYNVQMDLDFSALRAAQ